MSKGLRQIIKCLLSSVYKRLLASMRSQFIKNQGEAARCYTLSLKKTKLELKLYKAYHSRSVSFTFLILNITLNFNFIIFFLNLNFTFYCVKTDVW